MRKAVMNDERSPVFLSSLITYYSSLPRVLFDDRRELPRCRVGPEVGRGEYRVLERRAARARGLRRGEPLDGLAHDDLGVAHVLVEVLDDGLDRDGVVLLVPAVVVGDERERRVAYLGLARELRLLQVRHADDVHAPRAVHVRLGLRGERGPLHADVCAAAVHVDFGRAAGLFEHVAEVFADGVRERYVRDDAFAEEGGLLGARARAIEELVGDDHV